MQHSRNQQLLQTKRTQDSHRFHQVSNAFKTNKHSLSPAIVFENSSRKSDLYSVPSARGGIWWAWSVWVVENRACVCSSDFWWMQCFGIVISINLFFFSFCYSINKIKKNIVTSINLFF